MTKVVFEEKYYPAVKEMVYRTRLANGLTVALLPKKEFKSLRECHCSVWFGRYACH